MLPLLSTEGGWEGAVTCQSNSHLVSECRQLPTTVLRSTLSKKPLNPSCLQISWWFHGFRKEAQIAPSRIKGCRGFPKTSLAFLPAPEHSLSISSLVSEMVLTHSHMLSLVMTGGHRLGENLFYCRMLGPSLRDSASVGWGPATYILSMCPR